MVGLCFGMAVGLIVGGALVGPMGGVAGRNICHGVDGMLEVRWQTVICGARWALLFPRVRFDFPVF